MTTIFPQRLMQIFRERIAQAIRSGRLGHALLLVGPLPVAEKAAYFLCQALLCDNKQSSLACGACSSCLLVTHNNHPNILPLMSESARHKRSDETTKDSTESHSSEIRVDQIRELNREQKMQNYLEGPQICILMDGSSLTNQAANALLKTLEEPKTEQYIVILAPSIGSVLATIKSRCQRIFLSDVQDGEPQSNKAEKYIERIDSSSLSKRYVIIDEMVHDSDEIEGILVAMEQGLMRRLLASLSAQTSWQRTKTRQLIEAIDFAKQAIARHANLQLVLEDLILRKWPNNSR